MKQLTGLDATFLYMETATTFGHVSGLFIYERPSDDYDAFQAVKDTYASHLDMFEPLRRRLVEVPFGLDRPYWIEDPNFDLDYHIREIALPAPGDDTQLAEQVARIIARPCDRTRPLWEVYVIEGLASGDFAVLSKVHHATVDGAAGAIMTTMLLDPAPDTPLREPGPIPETEPLPSSNDMLRRGLLSLLRRPDRTIRLQLRVAQQIAEASRQEGLANVAGAARRFISAPRTRPRDDRDSAPEAPETMAPKTPFNASISPHRKVAFRSVPLAQIKDIKSCARCHGQRRRDGRLRRRPAALPRAHAATSRTSRWSAWCRCRSGPARKPRPGPTGCRGLFCPLPTNVADPAERVQTCTTGWPRPSSSGTCCPPTSWSNWPTWRRRRSRRVRPASPRRSASVIGSTCRSTSSSRTCPDRAIRSTSGAPGQALRPGLDDRRRPGPQHHGPELPRRARLRHRCRPRARARCVGPGRPVRGRGERAGRVRRCRDDRRSPPLTGAGTVASPKPSKKKASA